MTPPSVSMTAPAAGATVSGTSVTVSANATDNVGVASVQFRLDGGNLNAADTTAPYSTSWNSTTATDGSHTLTAIARDAAGNRTTATSVTVTVSNGTPPPPPPPAADTTPPSVSMTAPAAGATVSGASVTVSANATDNVGVAGVQFRLDGANLNAEDTTAPYSITWNSTTATNGSHTLTAIARDAAGNTTTATTVTVTVSNATPPPPAPGGLVAAFGFNEGTGTTVADASGNGNGGTISGATWTLAGKFGAALSYNGVNNMVTVADANSLDLTTGMTLEAWVNPSELGAIWRTAIIKEAGTQLAYALYGHATDTSQPSGHANVGTDTWTRGTGPLPVNSWTHLAVTYDGAALKLYVNGTLASSKPLLGNILTSTGALRFGGNSIWSEWFKGTLDEIRIYNRALAATEIQTDMGRPVGP
jgi:YD repeat-containing protein